MSRLYFPSKKDPILTVLVIAVIVAPLIAALLQVNIPALIIMSLIMLPTGAFIAWLWTTTGYTLTDDILGVQSGPLQVRIRLSDIRYVRPSRSVIASPALSFDRLAVGYASSTIYISPGDKERFVAELRRRCPDAEI